VLEIPQAFEMCTLYLDVTLFGVIKVLSGVGNVHNVPFCSHVFEDDGENKLSYTAIFEEYTSIIEDAIEEHLTGAVR
jgi:hypothetical protein